MYIKVEPFGYSVYGELIGSTWLSLVEVIVKNGQLTVDENRKRYSLQNIRIRSATAAKIDPLIKKYANQESIKKIVDLTLNEEIMHDIDITPSFSPGSQSYFARIKNTWKRLGSKEPQYIASLKLKVVGDPSTTAPSRHRLITAYNTSVSIHRDSYNR